MSRWGPLIYFMSSCRISTSLAASPRLEAQITPVRPNTMAWVLVEVPTGSVRGEVSLNHSCYPCLGMHVDRAPAKCAHPKCQICETELRPGSSFERGFSPQDYYEGRPDGPVASKPYPGVVSNRGCYRQHPTKDRRNGCSGFTISK